MTFFANHPIVPYVFGNQGQTALFNNLTVYVDLIDQVKSNISFYETHTILDGDRPDTLSQKLYGSPDYHWTFFLMNDNLREQGWPLPKRDLRAYVQSRYRNRVGTTTSILANKMLPGSIVRGTTTGVIGTVIKRNLDLGQVIIKPTTIQANGQYYNFDANEILQETKDGTDVIGNTVLLHKEVVQYNSVDHYINGDGVVTDIDPYNTTISSELTPVTVMDKYNNSNDLLQNIVIIRPKSVRQVVSEYYRLLKV